MPDRIQAVIDARGGPTHYYLLVRWVENGIGEKFCILLYTMSLFCYLVYICVANCLEYED